jgi:hypothetical protein
VRKGIEEIRKFYQEGKFKKLSRGKETPEIANQNKRLLRILIKRSKEDYRKVQKESLDEAVVMKQMIEELRIPELLEIIQ